jgi:magnesium-transporting ATPase (P-type)
MDKFSRENYDRTLSQMRYDGLITFVYSKAYLHDPLIEDEYPDKDLHFMQVVGVEEKLRPLVQETVDKMKKMNLWLLSGDSSSRVIPIAYKSGIIDPFDSII